MLKQGALILVAGLSIANVAFAGNDSWTDLDPRVRAQEEKVMKATVKADFKAPAGTRFDVIDRNSPL